MFKQNNSKLLFLKPSDAAKINVEDLSIDDDYEFDPLYYHGPAIKKDKIQSHYQKQLLNNVDIMKKFNPNFKYTNQSFFIGQGNDQYISDMMMEVQAVPDDWSDCSDFDSEFEDGQELDNWLNFQQSVKFKHNVQEIIVYLNAFELRERYDNMICSLDEPRVSDSCKAHVSNLVLKDTYESHIKLEKDGEINADLCLKRFQLEQFVKDHIQFVKEEDLVQFIIKMEKDQPNDTSLTHCQPVEENGQIIDLNDPFQRLANLFLSTWPSKSLDLFKRLNYSKFFHYSDGSFKAYKMHGIYRDTSGIIQLLRRNQRLEKPPPFLFYLNRKMTIAKLLYDNSVYTIIVSQNGYYYLYISTTIIDVIHLTKSDLPFKKFESYIQNKRKIPY